MKTIGLFCGGFSSEYDISMKSAETIYDSFPEEYSIHKIQVTKEKWFANQQLKRMKGHLIKKMLVSILKKIKSRLISPLFVFTEIPEKMEKYKLT